MAEAGTDLAVREERALTLIDSGEFAERVAPLLPDSVPVRRFLQVAKTAIRTNADLAGADQRTLMGCLIRCAQDGLVPDGREAALNVYGNKVSYLPMIGGLRKVLAEYGWTLKTRVVFANDEFDYSEEPQQIRHVPTRPGADRGDRIAVYAVATHRDGRRLQAVLNADDVAKRRAKAKTQNVWNEWPDAMWEKSAGHAIFDEIPKAERDRMIVPADNGVDDAVELLYGPDGTVFREIAAAPTSSAEHESLPSRDEGTDVGGDRQQATSAPGQDADVVPGEDDDSEPTMPLGETAGTAGTDGEELRAAAEVVADTKIPNGLYEGVALREVAAIGEDGHGWIDWALSHPGKFEGDFHAALETFVQGYLPDLWEQHTQRQAA